MLQSEEFSNQTIKIFENLTECNNQTIKSLTNLNEHINTLYSWLAFTTALGIVNIIITLIMISKLN